MIIMSPSILSADFTVLGEQLKKCDEAGAEYVHIDVMDGLFVPSISYGMPVIKSIRKATDRVFDVHLMIQDPERYLEEFADCGADLITFHLEATKDPDKCIELIRGKGKKVGISIKPGTPVETLTPFLDRADLILVMTVEPGFGGQSYIDYCTDKIAAVRKMIDDCGRDIRLEVDGGINRTTMPVVLNAGADTIVAGSAVFKGDIEANIKELMAFAK